MSKKQKNEKNKNLTFEDIIGKISIKDGVISLPNGKYITILEIVPVNFDFKTALDKEKIIDFFAQATKIGPVNVQIKSMSRKASTDKYINVLNRDFKKETDPALFPYQKDYSNLIRQLGIYSGISRRFFIVMDACGDDNDQIQNYDDAVYYLDKAKRTVRNSLRACGNEVVLHEKEDDFLLETLFEFANKDKSVFTLQDKKEAIYQKAKEITDNDEELLDSFEIPVTTLISPNEIEFFSEYCVVDNTYYAFLYIPSNEYPEIVSYAWLSGIICGAEGIDVDIFAQKKDAHLMKNKLKTKMRVNKAIYGSMKNTESDNFEELGNSLASSSFIRNKLNNREDFFYIVTMFTISAPDIETLYQKVSAVKNMFDSIDVELAECEYKIKEAFSTYMPLNTIDPYLLNHGKRNVTTSGLSAFYPFNSFEVSDTDGVLLGLSENKTMLVVDNFDTSKFTNANIALLGTSGAGKTFTLQTMCLRFRLKGIQTFVIVPTKGDEFERGCREAVNGEFVTISSGSSSRINIMEIRPEQNDNLKRLGFSTKSNRQSLLSEKIDKLLTFFSLAFGEMSNEEKTLLDNAILKTYELKGITKENDSLILEKKEILKENNVIETKIVYKEMPILEDLYNILKEDPKTERLATILLRFVTGSASAFNGQTNVDLNNKYIVFDLSYLSDELKALGMFVALDFIWDAAKQDKTQKKVVAVDEAWMLLYSNPLAAEFMVDVFKTIRGFGGSAIAATQDIGDFFALENGKYGKAILNNSAMKMILKLTEDEGRIVQQHFNLTYQELKAVTGFSRGQVLAHYNNSSFMVDFKASPKETLMITTDIKLLQKLANGDRITSEDLRA